MLKLNALNTEISPNDISKPDKAKYDMLLYITQQSQPVSAYQAKNALHMNQPTARNICIRLEQEGYLAVYKKEKKGRKKLMYGPRWQGLVFLCGSNSKMYKEMDTILDGWFTNLKFKEILEEEYGPIVTKNPEKAKTLVKKLINHIIRSYEEFDNITDEEYEVWRLVLGQTLYTIKHPAVAEDVKEFYQNVKFYKANTDRAIALESANARFFTESVPNLTKNS